MRDSTSPTVDMWSAATAVVGDVASIRVEPLAGGSSASVARLDVTGTTGDRRTMLFRQHADRARKGHADQVAAKEFAVTAALADLGLAVPAPLAVEDGSHRDGPWLVTEFVDGVSAIGRTAEPAIVDRMAEFLVRLHESNVAATGLGEVEDPVAALPAHVTDDELGRRLLRVLADGVTRRPNPSVLIHGDYWPGNVLLDDDEIVAVIDWEDARLGDPLVDVACARVELTEDSGMTAADRFTETYRRLRPEVRFDDLAIWDVYVSTTALSSMHLWGLTEEEEVRRRTAATAFLSAALDRLGSRRGE